MPDVLALIAAHFARLAVDPNDTLADLGADELTPIELAIEIDEQLGVYIEDDAIGLDTTAGEIVALVERLVAEKEARAA